MAKIKVVTDKNSSFDGIIHEYESDTIPRKGEVLYFPNGGGVWTVKEVQYYLGWGEPFSDVVLYVK